MEDHQRRTGDGRKRALVLRRGSAEQHVGGRREKTWARNARSKGVKPGRCALQRQSLP
jgi:hypothetical protein